MDQPYRNIASFETFGMIQLGAPLRSRLSDSVRPALGDVLRDLQVASFRDTFSVAAGVCFASLLPAAFLGRRKQPTEAERLTDSQKVG